MKTRSLLRKKEYERLARLRIEGRILDVGGSKKSGYHELIQGTHTFEVGNIDPAYDIDTVFDAEETWPYENATFEGVLYINLLEHLYKPQQALAEGRRVLKDGGIAAGVVPFMYNVHGSPNDYFRYTDAALTRMLKDAGFTSIRVEPLGTGAFGVIYQTLLGFVRWHWLAHILEPLFTGVDRLLAHLRPGNGLTTAYMPLGYYFEARP